MPLDVKRHFEATNALKDDTPYEKKVPSLIWRGATTGQGLRADYVRELSRAGFNAKFNHVNQKREKWITSPEMMGEFIPFETMQKHRYLLSLEGNDVATNLAYVMASNSIVIMPPPTKETWFRHGLLRPWAHYVPLESPNASLLEERIAWLDNNIDMALGIMNNAHKHARVLSSLNKSSTTYTHTLRSLLKKCSLPV